MSILLDGMMDDDVLTSERVGLADRGSACRITAHVWVLFKNKDGLRERQSEMRKK